MKAGVTGDQVLRIRRTSAIAGVVMGVVSVIALSIAGYPQGGIGVCIGLAFGAWLLNSLVKTALSVPLDQVKAAKKNFIASRMVRLMTITGGVLILCFAARQIGLGTLGGLAGFYVVMLAASLRVVSQSLHQALPGDPHSGPAGTPDSDKGAGIVADTLGFVMGNDE